LIANVSGPSERAERVSHASGAGLRGPRERACWGVRRGEAPRMIDEADALLNLGSAAFPPL